MPWSLPASTCVEKQGLFALSGGICPSSSLLCLGYEYTFQVKPAKNIPAGSHWSVHGYTPLDSLGRRETTVVAVDALIISDEDAQYRVDQMKREILKAVLGFQGDPFEEPVNGRLAPVATGKW